MAARAQGFQAVHHVIQTAVDAGVVPGAVILCARDGSTRLHEAFGARQLQPERLGATVATIYDIASLTKAVCTSVLMMKAVAAGQVNLDEPVVRHLPEFTGAGKEAVTLRHLLCHASGLPAHRPFHHTTAGHAVALAAAREPLINAPGSVSVYSDLGFILLGWILERVTGALLDDLFRDNIALRLGLASIRFVNLRHAQERADLLGHAAVAPTQISPARGGLVHGKVDDLNAFAMAGVAGHAGLFSDAADLAAIARALVAAWDGTAPGERSKQAALSASPDAAGAAPATLGIPRDIIQEFWRPAGIAGGTWRLGWDGPAAMDSQAGSRMPREAVGHLGFTGCSLWIDPARAVWIILLTNRVHPVAQPDPRFKTFRTAVHDAALAALLR